MNDQLFTHPVQPRDTDERYTPKWVFDGLGLTFDLDVAAPPDGPLHVPAARWYSAADDGLAQPWDGLVWCNPPYSQSTAWADRFVAHGCGVWLGPIASSAWFQRILAGTELAWFCADFPFIAPDHSGKHAAMPLAFFAAGYHACAGLRNLASSGRHEGQLMQVAQ